MKRFYETSGPLIGYLKKSTHFVEINGEKILPNVLKEVYSIVEPTVIHIRTGGNASNELRK